jgi:hypothetical protein
LQDVTNLFLDVVQRVGGVNGEADEDDMGVGVGERTKTVVILLASGIPKGELNMLSVDLDIGNVVFEDSWDVDLQKKGNEQGSNNLHGRAARGISWLIKAAYLGEGSLGEDTVKRNDVSDNHTIEEANPMWANKG